MAACATELRRILQPQATGADSSSEGSGETPPTVSPPEATPLSPPTLSPDGSRSHSPREPASATLTSVPEDTPVEEAGGGVETFLAARADASVQEARAALRAAGCAPLPSSRPPVAACTDGRPAALGVPSAQPLLLQPPPLLLQPPPSDRRYPVTPSGSEGAERTRGQQPLLAAAADAAAAGAQAARAPPLVPGLIQAALNLVAVLRLRPSSDAAATAAAEARDGFDERNQQLLQSRLLQALEAATANRDGATAASRDATEAGVGIQPVGGAASSPLPDGAHDPSDTPSDSMLREPAPDLRV